jgi:hypothetical protein
MARQRLNISKSTYYEAIATLQTHEFFDFDDVVLRVRNKVGVRSREKLSEKGIVRETEPESEKSDTSPKNRTGVRETEPESEKSESQPPEPISSNSPSEPQYSSVRSVPSQEDLKKERERQKEIPPDPKKDKEEASHPCSDVKESVDALLETANPSDWSDFSAPGNDTNFFKFVVQKVAKLPQPPADALCVAESWIRKQGHLLYTQYVSWVEDRRRVERARQTPPRAVPDAPPPPKPATDCSLAARLEKYRSLWQVDGLRRQIRQTLEAHPEWGIEIGANGPQEVMAYAYESAAVPC